MNLWEKREFCIQLIRSVQDTIVVNLAAVPEEWDGHELRQYIADKFAEQTTLGKRPAKDVAAAKRLRKYRNEVTVRNL